MNLSLIEIESINSIAGTGLYQALNNMIKHNNVKKYKLIISLSDETNAAALQKNSDIIMQSVNQVVQYQLVDINTQKELTSGSFNYSTTYSLGFTEYANYIHSQNTIDNLTQDAAKEIISRLIIYFAKL
ncbi:MAG: hypothetical protein AB8B67_03445 [Rickettsiaceae bacterium]